MVEAISNDPYRLPEETYSFINISGGRTSAYMLHHLLERYGGVLPDNCECVFQNTGKEHPATLDFLKKIEEEWSVPITWLEYRYDPTRRGTKNTPRQLHVVVDYDSASRDGEPFNQLLQRKKRPPNIKQRFCTEEMKVKTLDRYAKRELGIKSYAGILGIRKDEGARVRASMITKCTLAYPLVYAGVTESMVKDFWNSHSFDLEISSNLSNCDLCFLKGRKKIKKIMDFDDSLANWWIDVEESTGGKFRNEITYREILERSDIVYDDEPIYSCFCGD